MKVSIIVPVYNVSKYIVRCVESIKNQSYDNIECILVDDCSPDNSMLLARKCIEDYQGAISFIFLQHSKNGGLSAARNTGTAKATGEYIYYLDSDDALFIDSIKNLVELANKYPEAELIQGNTETVPTPEKNNDWRNILYKNFPEYIDDNLWVRNHFYDLKVKQIPVNAWNKLIKKEFLIENQFFFKEGVIHEDELWMFYVVKKLKKIAFTTKYTCYHYITPGSIMQSGNKDNTIKSMAVILDDICKNFTNPLVKKQKIKYLGWLYQYLQYEKLQTATQDFLPIYKKIAIKNALREILRFRLQYFLHLFLLIPPMFLKRNRLYGKCYFLFEKWIFKKQLFI